MIIRFLFGLFCVLFEGKGCIVFGLFLLMWVEENKYLMFLIIIGMFKNVEN